MGKSSHTLPTMQRMALGVGAAGLVLLAIVAVGVWLSQPLTFTAQQDAVPPMVASATVYPTDVPVRANRAGRSTSERTRKSVSSHRRSTQRKLIRNVSPVSSAAITPVVRQARSTAQPRRGRAVLVLTGRSRASVSATSAPTTDPVVTAPGEGANPETAAPTSSAGEQVAGTGVSATEPVPTAREADASAEAAIPASVPVADPGAAPAAEPVPAPVPEPVLPPAPEPALVPEPVVEPNPAPEPAVGPPEEPDNDPGQEVLTPEQLAAVLAGIPDSDQ